MANPLKFVLRHTYFRKERNLVSLENPYVVMRRLLRGHLVTGILDAGASHGPVTRRLLRLFPQAHAYAFEPQPLYRDRLTAFAQEEPRFHPQFFALSDEEGTADFYVTKSLGTTSLFKPGERLKALYPAAAALKSIETVDITTIDAWAARNGHPDIQLMKFDIQGGELRAMKGAARTLRTSTLLVYTEVFFNPLYENGALFSQIDLLLREFGFILYTIFKPRTSESGMLIQGNALYLQPDRVKIDP
ncbi:MAG: FkbM family methyltransferase [Nitrospirota bacterium]